MNQGVSPMLRQVVLAASVALLAASVALLSACAMTPMKAHQRIEARWVGKPIEEAVAALGKPGMVISKSAYRWDTGERELISTGSTGHFSGYVGNQPISGTMTTTTGYDSISASCGITLKFDPVTRVIHQVILVDQSKPKNCGPFMAS